MFAAVGDPTFRRIWAFGGFYYTYRATELAVLSWFVLTLTDSEFQVALVGISRITPLFLFGLVAGSLSDRFSRPRLMAIGQGSNLVAAAVAMRVISISASWSLLHRYCLSPAPSIIYLARHGHSPVIEDACRAHPISSPSDTRHHPLTRSLPRADRIRQR